MAVTLKSNCVILGWQRKNIVSVLGALGGLGKLEGQEEVNPYDSRIQEDAEVRPSNQCRAIEGVEERGIDQACLRGAGHVRAVVELRVFLDVLHNDARVQDKGLQREVQHQRGAGQHASQRVAEKERLEAVER